MANGGADLNLPVRGDYSALRASGDGCFEREGVVTDQDGGSGKGKWPEMRSLGWPPEGIEPKPADENTGEAAGAGGGADSITPFELAPDPAGSGALVVVPVSQPTPETDGEAAADVAPEPEPEPTQTDSASATANATGHGCAAALVVEEVRALRRAVDDLTAAIRGLSHPSAAQPSPVVHAGDVTRSITDAQARQDIQEYFMRNLGQTLYPAQVADALNLPLLKVAELCETLAVRGQISRNTVS
jgi:hypothetical protein